MKRRLLGRPPGTPIPDAARRGRPDWQQSDPRWIRQTVALAGRLPSGGWYVIDAVRAIGERPHAAIGSRAANWSRGAAGQGCW